MAARRAQSGKATEATHATTATSPPVLAVARTATANPTAAQHVAPARRSSSVVIGGLGETVTAVASVVADPSHLTVSYVCMTPTRERLLVAARACLGRTGLAGATSREITREADANLGAITYYFGSKEELVAEALADALREWLAPAMEVLSRDGDPAERMLVAIRTLVSTFEAHRNDAPLFLEAVVQAPRVPSLHRRLVALWGEARSLLGAQMIDLQNRGLLPPWVDPEAMGSLLIAVATGLVMEVTVDPEGPDLPAMAAQFGSLLLSSRSTADERVAAHSDRRGPPRS